METIYISRNVLHLQDYDHTMPCHTIFLEIDCLPWYACSPGGYQFLDFFVIKPNRLEGSSIVKPPLPMVRRVSPSWTRDTSVYIYIYIYIYIYYLRIYIYTYIGIGDSCIIYIYTTCIYVYARPLAAQLPCPAWEASRHSAVARRPVRAFLG